MVKEPAARSTSRGVPAVHVLARRTPPFRDRTVCHVRADLTRPGTLRGSCEGVGTLVHTAAYVGRDPARCEAVNHHGTLTLLNEARAPASSASSMSARLPPTVLDRTARRTKRN
ncbi:hypothetical protein ACWZEH_35040 (plasmid) [Streptomyces sp. QTS137]